VVVSIDGGNLGKDVVALADFYEAVVVCAENGICDLETTALFFGEAVTSFYHMHFPYIVELRKSRGYSKYADGVERLSLMHRKRKSTK
ncbi:MAG: hypothetical protein MJA83_00930, partial [Gammaproteobacteria bacterium]|nr:hypothetical protein [Gammaproteobacteria bacterium]